MKNKKANFHYIELSNQAGVATVRLNRPLKKNAMSFAMMHELIAAAKQIAQDKSVRVVLLTGAGDSFCAGIDLKDLSDPKNQAYAMWQLVKPTQSLFQKACLVWRELPVPVIAVLHGHCIGAGLQLALAADVRIAQPDTQLSVMEAKWGLVPDMGLTQSALGVVSADVLKELAMTARILQAEQAQKLGLITHVSEDPNAKAQQLAQELMARSPDAVLASKRVINQMYQQSACTLYQEKVWQIKMLLGQNRKLAVKKAKDSTVAFAKRQFG